VVKCLCTVELLSLVLKYFKEIYQPINLDTIQYIVDKLNINAINPDILYENGFISKNDKVKILARGELKKAVEISAHCFY